jgi:hypothetical protein
MGDFVLNFANSKKYYTFAASLKFYAVWLKVENKKLSKTSGRY